MCYHIHNRSYRNGRVCGFRQGIVAPLVNDAYAYHPLRADQSPHNVTIDDTLLEADS